MNDSTFPTNTSEISFGNIDWQWNFGDGTPIDTAFSPTHVYNTPGGYTVTLIAISDSGCADTATKAVQIHPAPKADFNPDTVCFSDSTQFMNLSTISSGNIANLIWNFGDGSPLTNDQNPYHFFPLGNYTVILIAVSGQGCVDDTAMSVGVYPLPQASFSYANACENEQPVSFTDSSTVQSGTIAAWEWTFGDLSNGSGQVVQHTYSSPGNYFVKLIVTSDNGCRDTLQKDIEIFPAPHAEFTADDTAGCATHCVNFTDQSTIANGTIAAWNWTSVTEALEVTGTSTCFSNPGTYTVSLAVTSDKGCKDTLIKSNYITVFPLPVADFSLSPETNTVQDMSVAFSDRSSGSILQWDWTFFDNDSALVKGISSVQNPFFDFASSQGNSFVFFLNDTGSYPVQLVITTEEGCLDSIVKIIKTEGIFYLSIPNAFTPDGDGWNDFFFPAGIGIAPQQNFNFFVFDRWGSLIYESHDLAKPWDGRFNNKAVQQDVYVWLLQVQETTSKQSKHNYTGHVTVVR